MSSQELNASPPVPKCGSSDQRNIQYEENFSPKQFFSNLISTESPIIFDVGAHQGESILFFKSIFDSPCIYSFEPEPKNFEILQEESEAANSFAFNVAVGDSDETVMFYRQDISHLGGLLPINKNSSDSLGYAVKAKNEAIAVEKIKLDTFCKENSIDHIDLLKIDVQGFEVGVLRGAAEALKNTECVTVEVSLYDFYEGESSPLLNVEQLMRNAGFSLWDISKISKNPKNLRTDWIEVVYRKVNAEA